MVGVERKYLAGCLVGVAACAISSVPRRMKGRVENREECFPRKYRGGMVGLGVKGVDSGLREGWQQVFLRVISFGHVLA